MRGRWGEGRGQITPETAGVSGLDSQCCAPWCDTLDKSIFVWKRSELINKGQVETKKPPAFA